VEEAATDMIALQQAQGVAEPWSRASFIDTIVNLQPERWLHAAPLGGSLLSRWRVLARSA
jgi:predicted ATPase